MTEMTFCSSCHLEGNLMLHLVCHLAFDRQMAGRKEGSQKSGTAHTIAEGVLEGLMHRTALRPLECYRCQSDSKACTYSPHTAYTLASSPKVDLDSQHIHATIVIMITLWH